ncbi:uncharacterized protein LOC115091544 isoform X2 [Rhinatrema bivittatum]|uniref:uncharacterized protein LOC115091544 isoform X2 n=1 Tax=Rhinatrema bivittatum TaxID=194408 RepID=UPI001125C926|nr:uncharacterized protein LOC115091544 isoform X2 [Rhinatrema bivittatum]
MASSLILPYHEHEWLVRQAHRPLQRDRAEIRNNAQASWSLFGLPRLRDIIRDYVCRKKVVPAKKGKGRQLPCYPPDCLRDFKNVHILRKMLRNSNAFQAARAWLTLASEKDRKAIDSMIAAVPAAKEKKVTRDYGSKSYIHQAIADQFHPAFIASTDEWLKKAGKEDVDAFERFLKTLCSGSYRPLWDEESVLRSLPRMPPLEYDIHPHWQSEKRWLEKTRRCKNT